MDDDELNEELDDEASHEIDSNHEDAVLKTPPDSIKSKSPEPTTVPSSDITQKKVILKRKLNIAVAVDNAPNNEVTSTTPLEKTRKFSIISAATDKTVPAPSVEDKISVEDSDKKIVKLSELTAKERLELRAKKFGAPIATESLKVARSERFGLTSITSKTESDSSQSSTKNGNSSTANVDLLKKRAERFGGSVSKVMNKIENLEKLQKRNERFGKSNENKDVKVTVSAGTMTSEQMAEKARLRLERFKTSA